MDFMMVYSAWLLNAGLPQEYFDHPGYLTILILSVWFKLLHAIGALDVHALSALPAARDTAAYNGAWTAAVRSARLASLALSLAFVTTFYFLLRRLLHDRRVAVAGTLALAFSGGLAMHARIVRTELLSAGLMTIAVLLLLIAAQSPRMRLRPLLVG
jgi:predicted membrane-bound mannosyltransferase